MTCSSRHGGPPPRAGAAAFLLCAAVGLAPAAASAQVQPEAPGGRVNFWGTEVFSNLLAVKQLTPVAAVKDLSKHTPPETLIVVFGDTRELDAVRAAVHGNLRTFVDQGGAVLIASDRHTVFAEFGRISISGKPMREAPDPRFALLGLPDCPLIRNYDPQHPVFQGLTRPLGTIFPSQIRFFRKSLQGVASLADFSSTEMPRQFPPGRAYMVGSGDARPGRILIVGGHDCFLNILLLRHDLDNRAFVKNCVDWLTEGGRRKHCLFLDNNVVRSKFDVPLDQLPFPIPDEDWLNEFVKKAEDENRFNETFLELFPKPLVLRVLFLALSVLVVCSLIRRLFTGRATGEPGLPLTTRTLEVTTSGQPLLAQRYELLTRKADLTEIARSVARQWFEMHGVTAGASTPRTDTPGNPRARRRWQSRLETIWQIAEGRTPGPVRPRRFHDLLRTLQQADERLRTGKLQLRPG